MFWHQVSVQTDEQHKWYRLLSLCLIKKNQLDFRLLPCVDEKKYGKWLLYLVSPRAFSWRWLWLKHRLLSVNNRMKHCYSMVLIIRQAW